MSAGLDRVDDWSAKCWAEWFEQIDAIFDSSAIGLVESDELFLEQIRTDETHKINRMFADVSQDEPVIEAEPGFEGDLSAYNLFAYLSRSDVTWNPSVVSVCKASLYCPTTEEYILPVFHGNDRVEWFVQMSDEIRWDVEDRDSGKKRSAVTMKAGDVAAMPADIRHQGYSPKRSMLLVWENASAELPQLIASGQAPTYPVDF